MKEVHLQVKDLDKLHKSGMEERYQSQLRLTWEKYGDKNIIPTMQQMVNLDKKIDMMELYQAYCDENMENNLKRHNFVKNKCTYCQRSVAGIASDAFGKKAEMHAKEMKEYVDMLNKRYCLQNDFMW